jgi:hypothetical protein
MKKIPENAKGLQQTRTATILVRELPIILNGVLTIGAPPKETRAVHGRH